MKHELIGSQGHIAQYDLRGFNGRAFLVTDLHGCYDLLHEQGVQIDKYEDIE